MSFTFEAPGADPVPKQTPEECIVMFLDICSDNISDHIIDADI